MNRTSVEHVIVGLALQFVIWLACGESWAGALFVTGLFLGREHAQREYHLGDPSKLVGYEALDLWRWSRDGLLDLLVPVFGVWAVVVLVRHAGS